MALREFLLSNQLRRIRPTDPRSLGLLVLVSWTSYKTHVSTTGTSWTPETRHSRHSSSITAHGRISHS